MRRRLRGRIQQDDRLEGGVAVVSLNRGRGFDEQWERLSQFDLVLLYCGSIGSAAEILNRWNAADAVVLVAKRLEVDAGLLDEVDAAGLGDRCIGMVLTPDAELARKRA
jgi:hypothetical protein